MQKHNQNYDIMVATVCNCSTEARGHMQNLMVEDKMQLGTLKNFLLGWEAGG